MRAATDSNSVGENLSLLETSGGECRISLHKMSGECRNLSLLETSGGFASWCQNAAKRGGRGCPVQKWGQKRGGGRVALLVSRRGQTGREG